LTASCQDQKTLFVSWHWIRYDNDSCNSWETVYNHACMFRSGLYIYDAVLSC